MKNVVTLLLLMTLIGCNSQEKEKPEEKQFTETQPQEKWKVQKEYDEQGNLIRYDSVYSWTYSNVQGDSIQVNLDSVMDTFKNYFEETSSFRWDDYFSYFPKNDSLLLNDFFKPDYFFENWKRQHPEFENMIRQMDSTRNEFLKKFYPGLQESKNYE